MDDLFGSDDEVDDVVPETQLGDQQQVADQEPDPADLEDDVGPAEPAGSDDEDANRGRAASQADHFSSDPEDEAGQRRRRHAVGPPMDLDAPLLPIPPTNSVHLLRTTNIVGIQPRAFDPTTYEREEETFEDEQGRARVRLASNAIIRWRLRRLPDGREVPESNARFVRWEDGSLQLFLGHEVLDVATQDIHANNQYLFCLRGLIQGQCPLTSRMALRPASLDSGLHKRLREAVDKRHVKVHKVATAGGLQNPELEQARREKAEEEKISGRRQLARKQERVVARAYGGGGYKRTSRLSDKYLEDDQEWEGDAEYDYDDGLTADQRARLSLARSRPVYEEQEEAEARRRLQAAKRGRGDDRGGASKRQRRSGSAELSDDDDEGDDESEYEEEGEGEEDEEPEYESSGDEDDSEEEGEGRKEKSKSKDKDKPAKDKAPPPKPKRRGVVLSDDDDE